MTDVFGYIGIALVAVYVVWMVAKSLSFQARILEGMTTAGDVTSSGEAGSATVYASAVKAKAVQLQDELLISKYRIDYENVILNMDDLIKLNMLKTVLNVSVSGDINASMEKLANLKAAKDSLDIVMKFVDET